MDIASLGFEVNSGQLKTANSELGKMSGLAGAVGLATNKFSKSFSGAAEAAASFLGIPINTHLDKMNLSFGKATGGAKGFVGAMGKVAAAALAVAAALAASFVLERFITETIAAEEALIALTSAFEKNAGAVGIAFEKIVDFSTEIQKTTKFADDAVQQASSMLLMFKRVKGDQFERALMLSADMAEKLKSDLPSAAQTLGRALQEPVMGMQRLSRAGIILSEEQKKQIIAFAAVNNAAGAQTVILDAIEKQMGGTAKAMRGTLGGAIKALKNSWGDLFELGPEKSEPFREAIEKLITAISDPAFVEFIQRLFGTFGMITLLVKGITLLVQGVALLQRGFEEAGNFASQFIEDANQYLGVDLGQVVKSSVNFIINSFEYAFTTTKILFTKLPDIFEMAMVDTANVIAKAFEWIIRSAITGINWFAAQVDKVLEKIGSDRRVGQIDMPGAMKPFGLSGSARDTQAALLEAHRRLMSNPDRIGDVFGGPDKPKPTRKVPTVGPPPDEDPMKTGTNKAAEAYAKIVKEAKDFIEKQQLLERQLGLTALQAARMKHEMDLLQKATADGNTITAAQRDELMKLADAMAQAEVKAQTSKMMFEFGEEANDFIRAQGDIVKALGMSKEAAAAYRFEQEMLNKAAKANIELSPEQIARIRELAGAMAEAQQRADTMTDAFDFGKDAVKGFFTDIVSGVREGKSALESLGNAVTNLIDKMINKLFDLLLNSAFEGLLGGSGGGGGLFGMLGNLFGMGGSAMSSGVGSVIGSIPIAGSFAKGGATPTGVPYLVGEHGPEVRVDEKPGFIFNQDQWSNMQRPDDSMRLEINQYFGESVNVATRGELQAMERRLHRTIPATIMDERSRGGQMRTVFKK